MKIPFDRTGFNPTKETEETSKKTTKETSKKTTKETSKKTTKEKIVKLLKTNPSLTRNDLVKILRMKEDAIQYHLNALKKSGKIIHRGATKAGYWEIINK